MCLEVGVHVGFHCNFRTILEEKYFKNWTLNWDLFKQWVCYL